MARRSAPPSLSRLLDHTSRPVYIVDSRRRIAYCNPGLATWLELEPERVVGRLVEYHSEVTRAARAARDASPPLADLCPPPRALAGEACAGTISCVLRDGRLVHRRAEFVPLDAPSGNEPAATLVLVAMQDLSPQEVTKTGSEWGGVDPSADELHRTIRQFRRAQAAQFDIESLLGDSSAMRKVRAQVAAAAACGANALITGPQGSGRRHVAHAIHYGSAGDATARLVPIDCEVLSDHLLRRALDTLQSASNETQHRVTLLLENLEKLSMGYQSQLASMLVQGGLPARVVATLRAGPNPVDQSAHADADGSHTHGPPAAMPSAIDPTLFDRLSTFTIRNPRLVDRLEDLPILAQCFLEACNRGSVKQVGAIRADALDLLALHSWPGELDELRKVVASAHCNCASYEIVPVDLPVVVHHAKQAAIHVRRPPPERIVLDEFLANIERDVIGRAMALARGNKTEAAELLGMTRPRLYRRLVQLGLVADATGKQGAESAGPEPEAPEFIEQEPEPSS